MPARPEATLQSDFERRWRHLTRPHVRALAWLLDAPDLLDSSSARWNGRIATLGAVSAADAAWLAALEHDPAPLDAALGPRFYSRLGLYAEKLLAFYFAHRGMLEAHGLQVRANRNDTVGEFDFLLRRGGALLHWEFATKFYLLDGAPDAALDCLVGPNLADTLGLKMRKILDKQLALALHPAAQNLLPQAVDSAQALVKGYLFYPRGGEVAIEGIAAAHNRGFWCTQTQAAALPGELFAFLPRLQWLAPYKVAAAGAGALAPADLPAALAQRFALAPAPLMLAILREENGWLLEAGRGFIVPDDWPAQAAARRAGAPA